VTAASLAEASARSALRASQRFTRKLHGLVLTRLCLDVCVERAHRSEEMKFELRRSPTRMRLHERRQSLTLASDAHILNGHLAPQRRIRRSPTLE
jgi:hypothetical protein